MKKPQTNELQSATRLYCRTQRPHAHHGGPNRQRHRSVLDGTWSASGFKQSTTWSLMTEDEKIELSKLLNKWLYEANGGAGCDTQKALRAYYKPEHHNCSPIMPSRLVQ